MIKISKNNSKLGNIPNFSTIPVQDCINCSECKADCYALKAYKQYPSVRASWGSNSSIMRANPEAMADSVIRQLSKRPPKMFRIHVAGDFINQASVDAWIRVAREVPATRFMSFTKSSHLDFSGIPENMVIIHSQWVGHEKLNAGGVNAWLEGDDRIPTKHFVCPGSAAKGAIKCDKCTYCWQKVIKLDVVFAKH